MNLDGIRITVTDVRRAGLCMKGARAWGEKNGISLSVFLREGVPAQQVWDTGDGWAQMVVQRKLEREGLIDG